MEDRGGLLALACSMEERQGGRSREERAGGGGHSRRAQQAERTSGREQRLATWRSCLRRALMEEREDGRGREETTGGGGGRLRGSRSRRPGERSGSPSSAGGGQGRRQGEGRRPAVGRWSRVTPPRSRSRMRGGEGPSGKRLAFLEKRGGTRVSKRRVKADFFALAIQISQIIIKLFGGIISLFSFKI